jgi:hypothetical protein
MQRTIAKAALTVLSLVAVLAMSPAPVGPPWISIEYPPSPFDATTRDAFLLVHAFHHGTPMNFPVGGKAEGLVGGKRRSIDLDFTRTSRQGVYALKKQWPAEGNWVLAIAVTQEGDSKAGALVELSSAGDVVKVSVPTNRNAEGWAIPRAITTAEVEAALKNRVALAAVGGKP